ncbi:MAG: AAA family ATPase [Parcubacteria group bacterium]
MFLKRLELQGFKSFAGKTAIDFPDGITAIVGPNGSGKSNITDAIRWLLGEREAKSLRGAKADDLIFAGTEKRARSGFAQASIYFDNSSGFFPVEYKEVAITRRVDRDGESRFLLNQSEVLLRDIIDFFARGRLGARGLNIISQGESDSFLRASPEERRILIEEILGLKEYLLKKHSSERELRNTRINLDKAKAMIEEMKPHIRVLRRQVGRYAERDKLLAELSELETAFYGGKVREILNDLSRYDPEIAALGEIILGKKKEISELEKELRQVESSEPEAKKQLEKIRLKRRELFNERLSTSPVVSAMPRNKKDPMVIIREIKALAFSAISGNPDSLKEALQKIISLTEELEEKVYPVPNGIRAAASLNPEFEAKMEAFNKALDELDTIEKKLTAEMEDFNSSFRKAIKAVETKKDELDELEDRNKKLSFEKEKIKYRKTELEHQLAAMGKSFSEFMGLPRRETSKPETKITDPISAERRIYRLRGELASIGEVDESIIKESEEAEIRFSSTSAQIDELEKASADLKTLIKELDYKIHREFSDALGKINKELSGFSKLMFGGGKIAFKLEEPPVIIPKVAGETDLPIEEEESKQGIEIEVSLPKKRIKGLEVLSGGERSLLSTAILFGLVSISPPPFIVLDEVDAALDERNARLFGKMLLQFEGKTQFIIVTHNRATMESANALYGVTMGEDGASKLVSLRLS